MSDQGCVAAKGNILRFIGIYILVDFSPRISSNTAILPIAMALTTLSEGEPPFGIFFTYSCLISVTKVSKTFQNFDISASKFRSTILYELTGFYPIYEYWTKDKFPLLYETIPRVNSAASEFKYYVSRKSEFDKAVADYNEYCRRTTYEIVSADAMYPSMRKKDEISKRDQFKNIVGHLLSFAEQKEK